MPRPARMALALLLAAACATNAALAESLLPGAESRPSAIAASTPTNVLTRLWSFLAGLRSKNGCSLDPFGVCGAAQGTTSSAPEELENGCSPDPFGRCLPGH